MIRLEYNKIIPAITLDTDSILEQTQVSNTISVKFTLQITYKPIVDKATQQKTY
jgi:hypothetical protein